MRRDQTLTRQRGSSVVEYALLTVIFMTLVLTLPALGNGICELTNRIAGFLGSATFTCVGNNPNANGGRGNNGGANNDGSYNNGGGNNVGGGNGKGGGNGNGNNGNGNGG